MTCDPLVSQVNSVELIRCKETVDEYLHSLEFSLPANAIYILDGGLIHADGVGSVRQSRRERVGSEQGELDEYYDGFGRLYNEEAVAAAAAPGPEGHDAEGLFDPQQNNVSPCPPLHPAVHE